jgi:hypothetical protein
LVNKFLSSTETGGSLTDLKRPVTGQYPEPDEFISQPYKHFR